MDNIYTVEPLIKDTLNKGHLRIKDTFLCTNLYSGSPKEDNLSINDPSQSVLCLGVPLYYIIVHEYKGTLNFHFSSWCAMFLTEQW